MTIEPKQIISVRPVWLREPGTAGHINGRSNMDEVAGKIGVYVIFEGDEETGQFWPVYVGSSGAKLKGPGMRKEPRGNLRKAILRHFYEYADDANNPSALYYQLKLFDKLQDRTSYADRLKKYDYLYRAYIFPATEGKSKEEREEIKKGIARFEKEKIIELKPRDNPEPAETGAGLKDVPF